MHEPGGVDRFEASQQLRGDLARPAEVQRPLLRKKVGERGAVHELHRHHLVAVLDNQVEHPADVWRDDLARATNLTPQQVPGAIVSDQVGSKRLERHFHAELHIEGMPHLSLTTATEHAQQAVAATENQGGERATGVAREGGDRFGILETRLPGSRRPRGPAGTSGTCLRAHHCQSTARRSRDSSGEVDITPLKIWKTEARRKVTPPAAPTA